jgi:tight adherence protein B
VAGVVTTAYLAAAFALAGCWAVRAVLVAGDHRAVLGGRSAPRWLSVPVPVRAALADAAVPIPAEVLWTAWSAVLAGTVALGLLAGGPGLALVAMTAVTGGPALALVAARGRSARLVDAALPDVLDAVARSLRSGATLRQALAEVAPRIEGRLGDDVRLVLIEADGGLSLVAALDDWPGRCPTPGVRLATAALALSVDAGGAAARAVDGVAATLRSNLALAGEVRAQSSQARLSGLVIALAPLAFGALAAGTDQRTAAFLLRTPFGLACLVSGLALDAVAAWWMHRITEAT